MTRLRLRPALALLSLVLVVPFAACGDGQDPVAGAKTESIYVTAGGLKYQVQLSRKLNPYDVEDKDYLAGIPNAAHQVANRTYTWFGVFLRVENRTNKGNAVPQTIQPASSFQLVDNEGNSASPVTMPAYNVYAYHPTPIPAGGVLPESSSTAGQGPIAGALILFKVDQGILERRPTQLRILTADGTTATVNLDI